MAKSKLSKPSERTEDSFNLRMKNGELSIRLMPWGGIMLSALEDGKPRPTYFEIDRDDVTGMIVELTGFRSTVLHNHRPIEEEDE